MPACAGVGALIRRRRRPTARTGPRRGGSRPSRSGAERPPLAEAVRRGRRRSVGGRRTCAERSGSGPLSDCSPARLGAARSGPTFARDFEKGAWENEWDPVGQGRRLSLLPSRQQVPKEVLLVLHQKPALHLCHLLRARLAGSASPLHRSATRTTTSLSCPAPTGLLCLSVNKQSSEYSAFACTASPAPEL